jgi:hypothetical protein
MERTGISEFKAMIAGKTSMASGKMQICRLPRPKRLPPSF